MHSWTGLGIHEHVTEIEIELGKWWAGTGSPSNVSLHMAKILCRNSETSFTMWIVKSSTRPYSLAEDTTTKSPQLPGVWDSNQTHIPRCPAVTLGQSTQGIQGWALKHCLKLCLLTGVQLRMCFARLGKSVQGHNMSCIESLRCVCLSDCVSGLTCSSDNFKKSQYVVKRNIFQQHVIQSKMLK